ncbi:MAG: hypothetical protein LBU89_06605 [Fibromonadaceae bacterium]|nr:hypothetical protein [Fibromonadaceae bacterium]
MPIREDNERFSIYLHPTSIAGSLLLYKNIDFFYLTVEYPLNGRYSLIAVPSVWSGKFLTPHNGESKRTDGRYYFRLGSGIGIRHFINGKSDGFYLQLMPSAYYTSQEGYWSYERNTSNALYRSLADGVTARYHDKTISGSIIDILGYIGYSAKFSRIRLFFDVGMGYAWNSLHPDPQDNLPLLLWSSYNKHVWPHSGAISLDINLGIGFAF